jgi:hypothetical protein
MLRRRLAHFRNALTAAPLAFPPGHYHSPICDPTKIIKWYRNPGSEETPLAGIDLHKDDQINRLLYWNKFLPDIQFTEFSTPPRRYYYGHNNLMYSLGDATCLYCFIRELNPKKYIEIGSGFSSACVLDTIDQLHLNVQCTFIDPEPARFESLLRPNETSDFRLLPKMVQDVPLETFDELDAGDILFVDSSHVLKTASDVGFELFSILPRLKPGVFVHFHDIPYPFEYWPALAIDLNYSWNDYLVKTSTQYLADFAPNLTGGSGLWLSVADL